MPHRVRDHAENFRGLGKLVHPKHVAQHAGRNLSVGGAFDGMRRGVCVDAAKCRRENARGESNFTHRQQNQIHLGISLGERQHAIVIRGLARGGDDFVGIRIDLLHAAQHRVERRSAAEVVIRDDEPGAAAQTFELRRHMLGGFDFKVHGLGSGFERGFEDVDLFFNAAVKASAVLMPPACGEYRGVWILFEKLANGLDAIVGFGQIIEPELKKALSCFSLFAGVRNELPDLRQP